MDPKTQAPAAPAATATPTVTPEPAAPAADPDKITLDDLFPETPAAPVVTGPAAPTEPQNAATTVAPGTPAATDEPAKMKAEMEQRLRESEQKLTQTLSNTVGQVEQKIQRNNELSNFFTNPDNEPFRKYQNDITKVATDPRFSGLKLDRVVAMALGPQVMLKLGAEMAQNANANANGNRTGGFQNNTQRVLQQGNKPDFSKMSNQDFEAYTQAIIRGQRPN